MSNAQVRLAENPDDLLRVIEIDAPLSAGGPDLLFRTLTSLRAQILLVQVRVAGDRLVHRLHVCDVDGGSLDDDRSTAIRDGIELALRERAEAGWRGPRRAKPRAS